jgi:hypothetical protein
MGELLAFHQLKTASRASCDPASGSAEIIFFPGVRYVRVDEPCQDHDDFGRNPSKIMNVIDSNSLKRDAGEKPASAFSHPALVRKPAVRRAARRREKPKTEQAS